MTLMDYPFCILRIFLALTFLPCAARAQNPIPQSPPQQAAPVPASPGLSWPGYLLGPGDSVRVTVWTGKDYLDQTLTVAADGTLMIPFLVNKIVSVSGMTSIQLRELIQSELQKVFLSPVVQVVTVGFESKRANLMGEVSPGHYPIYGNTRILDFVLQHGGFGPKANLTEVQVTRANGEKLRVNIYDIVIKGDKSQNIILNPDDLVFVPSLETIGNKYYMLGEVRSPGLLLSPEPLTLLEAIAKSGTLTLFAQTKHIFVVRLNPKGTPQVEDVRFEDLYRKGDIKGNMLLKNGDIVYVPRNVRTRIADVLNSVYPVLSFVRDTAYLATIIRNP
jgi:protein involved in polysaccharide export with SLBB domain